MAENSRSTAARRRRSSPGRSRGGAGRFLLGTAVGALAVCLAAAAWFYFGRPPVAVADAPMFWEHLTSTLPLQHRERAEAKLPPFPAGEDGFESAARVYRQQCASCHGVPGHEAPVGRLMLPHAQQFFGRDRRGTAAKPAGELFWPIAHGVRHSGMPQYASTLSNTELWNLALLLHAADQELPGPVSDLLTSPVQQKP